MTPAARKRGVDINHSENGGAFTESRCYEMLGRLSETERALLHELQRVRTEVGVWQQRLLQAQQPAPASGEG